MPMHWHPHQKKRRNMKRILRTSDTYYHAVVQGSILEIYIQKYPDIYYISQPISHASRIILASC